MKPIQISRPSSSLKIGQRYLNGAVWLSYYYKISVKQYVNFIGQERGQSVDRSIIIVHGQLESNGLWIKLSGDNLT